MLLRSEDWAPFGHPCARAALQLSWQCKSAVLNRAAQCWLAGAVLGPVPKPSLNSPAAACSLRPAEMPCLEVNISQSAGSPQCPALTLRR